MYPAVSYDHEALVNNDSWVGSIPEPQLTVRTMGGIPEAINQHAGEKCSGLMNQMV